MRPAPDRQRMLEALDWVLLYFEDHQRMRYFYVCHTPSRVSHCPIALFMSDPHVFQRCDTEISELVGDPRISEIVFNLGDDAVFAPAWRGLPTEFWTALQVISDKCPRSTGLFGDHIAVLQDEIGKFERRKQP